jgi:PAS domain S-box-containing protein
VISQISRQILAWVVILVVVPFIITGIVLYKKTEQVLTNQIYNTLEVASDALEAQLLIFLESKKNRTIDFSSDGFIRESAKQLSLQPGNTAAVKALNEHLRRNKAPLDHDIYDILVFNNTGKLVSATNGDLLREVEIDSLYFERGREKVVINTIENETGDRHFSVTAPLTDIKSGAFVGVITLRFHANAIDNILSGETAKLLGAKTVLGELGKRGAMYVIDKTKAVIAGPENLLGQQIDTVFLDRAFSQKEILGEFIDPSQKPRLAATMYIENPGWSIIASIPKKDAYRPLKRLTNLTAGFVLAGVSTILMLALFLGHRIAKPIIDLTTAAAKLARGKWNNRIPVPDKRGEITVLAQTFNQMARSLEQYYQAMQTSEKKYRSLFERSKDAIYMSTVGGQLLDVNQGMVDLFGYTREELLSIDVRQLFWDPSDRPKFQASIEKQGFVKDYELRLRRKDGSRIDCLITANTRWENDQIIGYQGIIHDITERKRATEELKTLHRLSQKLTETTHLKEIGRNVAAQTRYLFQHDAFYLDIVDEYQKMIIGVYSEDTPRGGTHPVEVTTKDTPLDSQTNLERQLKKSRLINRKEEPEETEFRPFGEVTRLSRSLMFAPIYWEKRIIGIISVQSYTPGRYDSRDLNLLQTIANQCGGAIARVQVEETIRKISRTVEQTADSVIITDHRGVIEYVNPAFEHLTGYTLDEARGSTPRILKSGKHDRRYYSKLWQTITAGKVYRGEIINRKKNGELYTELKTITPVKNARGKITHFISTGKDITEQKQAEEELRQAYQALDEAYSRASKTMAELETAKEELQKALAAAHESDRLKSEFLANTSHELRTPLNSIIGSLKLVLEGLCDSPEEEREFLKTALQSSNHLLQIINDIIDISKIEAGKIELNIEPVGLQDIFDEVYLSTHVQAEQKQLKFTIEIQSKEDIYVKADPQKLKQILLNLVGNSIKFTERGEIKVIASAEVHANTAEIQVIDTGVGVPPEKQDMVFKKFVQADGSTSRKYGGTGLGLSITKNLVELIGGTIELISAGEGKGTTVKLTFPLA